LSGLNSNQPIDAHEYFGARQVIASGNGMLSTVVFRSIPEILDSIALMKNTSCLIRVELNVGMCFDMGMSKRLCCVQASGTPALGMRLFTNAAKRHGQPDRGWGDDAAHVIALGVIAFGTTTRGAIAPGAISGSRSG
jgi:hypothetical protein